jgi:hypothetical protein
MPHLRLADGGALRYAAHLGSGSSGHVFLFKADDGSQAAVKTLRPAEDAGGAESDEEELQGFRLYEEMRASHPECARLFVPTAMASYQGLLFFAMPPATCTLAEAVDGGRFGAAEATASVAASLQQLHRAGYAYCDLKAHNVLVLRRGEDAHVVFCDLGAVARAGELGAATYPPPEHPSGLRVPATEAAAAWAVGVFLLTLLLGNEAALVFCKDAADMDDAQKAAWARSATARVREGMLAVGSATPVGRVLAVVLGRPCALAAVRAALEEACFKER